MTFELHGRTDQLPAARNVYLAFSPTIIRYSAQLVREAGLDRETRVSLYVDEDRFRVGFEFHGDLARPESYRLTWPTSTDGKRRACGVSSAAGGLVRTYDWVRAVAHRQKPGNRSFRPTFDGRLWIVQMGPAFEHTAGRDGETIAHDATGVYRYIRSQTGDVVYIGRGDIRRRLRDGQRAHWRFDRVEYSHLADPREQNHWERHWIEHHRRQHGRLPEYNRI